MFARNCRYRILGKIIHKSQSNADRNPSLLSPNWGFHLVLGTWLSLGEGTPSDNYPFNHILQTQGIRRISMSAVPEVWSSYVGVEGLFVWGQGITNSSLCFKFPSVVHFLHCSLSHSPSHPCPSPFPDFLPFPHPPPFFPLSQHSVLQCFGSFGRETKGYR